MTTNKFLYDIFHIETHQERGNRVSIMRSFKMLEFFRFDERQHYSSWDDVFVIPMQWK